MSDAVKVCIGLLFIALCILGLPYAFLWSLGAIGLPIVITSESYLRALILLMFLFFLG